MQTQQAQATMPAAPADTAPPDLADPMTQLRLLAQLNAAGILSDDCFAAAKSKFLGT
jgi:hypothetical protein